MVRISRNWELLMVIELTYTAFQEAFQEDLKYSDLFRDQWPQCIGDRRKEFIFYVLEMGLEKAVLIQVSSRPA